jgi:hypothetical protein
MEGVMVPKYRTLTEFLADTASNEGTGVQTFAGIVERSEITEAFNWLRIAWDLGHAAGYEIGRKDPQVTD